MSKFYKTGMFCPFEEIGCKFRHEERGDNLFRLNEEGNDDKIEDNENVEYEVEYEDTDETNVQARTDVAIPDDKKKVNNSSLPNPLVPELLWQRQPAAVVQHGHAEHPHPQNPDCDDEACPPSGACVCSYCCNWFDTRDSLQIHMRENHLAAILSSQFNPC